MCQAVKAIVQGCVKLILIVINVIALLAGLVLAVLGIFTMIKGDKYIPDVGVNLTPVAIFLIVLGALLLFIGCFGCFGAITGRHGLLNVYLILLAIIIILEVAVLIYGFVNKAKVTQEVTDAITDPFTNVNAGTATEEETATVASIQSLVKCCGIDGPDFWTEPTWTNGHVPPSCCAEDEEGNLPKKCKKADAYEKGCLGESEGMVKQALTLVIIVIVAIIVFQIVCMILAACSKQDYAQINEA